MHSSILFAYYSNKALYSQTENILVIPRVFKSLQLSDPSSVEPATSLDLGDRYPLYTGVKTFLFENTGMNQVTLNPPLLKLLWS